MVTETHNNETTTYSLLNKEAPSHSRRGGAEEHRTLGETSAHNTALAAGTGIGSIINQLGRTTFDRVMLASKTMDQIKGAIEGSGIKEKDIVEEKIFEGKMEDFADGAF